MKHLAHHLARGALIGHLDLAGSHSGVHVGHLALGGDVRFEAGHSHSRLDARLVRYLSQAAQEGVRYGHILGGVVPQGHLVVLAVPAVLHGYDQIRLLQLLVGPVVSGRRDVRIAGGVAI